MRVGPSRSDCRIRSQTTGSGSGSMARVVSVPGKGGTTRQVGIEKANESEPLVMRRKRRNVIETGLQSLVRDKLGGYLFTDQAVTGAKVVRARFRLLCGTWEPSRRCKGKSPSGRPMRRKVPKRRGGADWPVVAMKPGNAGGARGPTCSVLGIGQPERGGAGD